MHRHYNPYFPKTSNIGSAANFADFRRLETYTATHAEKDGVAFEDLLVEHVNKIAAQRYTQLKNALKKAQKRLARGSPVALAAFAESSSAAASDSSPLSTPPMVFPVSPVPAALPFPEDLLGEHPVGAQRQEAQPVEMEIGPKADCSEYGEDVCEDEFEDFFRCRVEETDSEHEEEDLGPEPSDHKIPRFGVKWHLDNTGGVMIATRPCGVICGLHVLSDGKEGLHRVR